MGNGYSFKWGVCQIGFPLFVDKVYSLSSRSFPFRVSPSLKACIHGEENKKKLCSVENFAKISPGRSSIYVNVYLSLPSRIIKSVFVCVSVHHLDFGRNRWSEAGIAAYPCVCVRPSVCACMCVCRIFLISVLHVGQNAVSVRKRQRDKAQLVKVSFIVCVSSKYWGLPWRLAHYSSMGLGLCTRQISMASTSYWTCTQEALYLNWSKHPENRFSRDAVKIFSTVIF